MKRVLYTKGNHSDNKKNPLKVHIQMFKETIYHSYESLK